MLKEKDENTQYQNCRKELKNYREEKWIPVIGKDEHFEITEEDLVKKNRLVNGPAKKDRLDVKKE